MNGLPKISVIIPFFNAEKTLSNAIESIQNQIFIDFELILVDNNSTDNSFAIAEIFAEKDKRIKLLKENTQGVVFASNKGMNLAQGKYIARMDADDISLPERLELQYNFLEKNTDVDLLGTCVKYSGSSQNKGFIEYVDYTNKFLTDNEIRAKIFSELIIINPTIMLRKTSAKKFGLYKNGDFPEDYEMQLRWAEKGAKFAKLPKNLLIWNDSENRLTRKSEKYSIEAFYKIKTPYLYKFLEKNNPFHPKVVIWGAGKLSKRRSNLLKNYGIEIEFYIDIDKKKTQNKDVIFYEDIPKSGKHFILSYSGIRGSKYKIIDFLKSKNYKEISDFLIIS